MQDRYVLLKSDDMVGGFSVRRRRLLQQVGKEVNARALSSGWFPRVPVVILGMGAGVCAEGRPLHALQSLTHHASRLAPDCLECCKCKQKASACLPNQSAACSSRHCSRLMYNEQVSL